MLLGSVPLPLVMLLGRPSWDMIAFNSLVTRRPERDLLANIERHSRLKSSMMAGMPSEMSATSSSMRNALTSPSPQGVKPIKRKAL